MENTIYFENVEDTNNLGILNIGWSAAMEAARTSKKVTAQFSGKFYAITSHDETAKSIKEALTEELKRWVAKEETKDENGNIQ